MGASRRCFTEVPVIHWPDDQKFDSDSNLRQMQRSWYVVLDGYLSDMPGRNESWTESVRFLDDDEWEYMTIATDFQGRNLESFSEKFSTIKLIDHVLLLDSFDRESLSREELDRTVGERTDALIDLFALPGWESYANMLEACLKPSSED